MKMIKYQLYKLPEGFIITSDEQPVKGLYFDTYINKIKNTNGADYDVNEITKQIIAQQDQIDFSSLSEEECKKIRWFDKIIDNNFEDLHDAINDRDISNFYIEVIKTYTKELLSDKMFNLKDMKFIYHFEHDAVCNARPTTKIGEGICSCVNRRIKSLSQKSWDIEIEMDRIPADRAPQGWDVFPKLTNGKVKITKIL